MPNTCLLNSPFSSPSSPFPLFSPLPPFSFPSSPNRDFHKCLKTSVQFGNKTAYDWVPDYYREGPPPGRSRSELILISPAPLSHLLLLPPSLPSSPPSQPARQNYSKTRLVMLLMQMLMMQMMLVMQMMMFLLVKFM